MATLFGSYIRPILSVFAAIFVTNLAYTGIKTDMSLPYFIIAIGGAALHLLWQMCTWNPEDDADSIAKWKSNGNLGYIITAGVISGVYLPDLFKL
ncbi:hypothetical protein DAEQUDRAFT_769914 [Daedalea quercina L-15889]|uniref:Uncharacterized protein n=1 Tax=Daedalea quercina L-15889 TaxID=1314783 RepID=A0A165LAE6_9APHY|nr:hypothetical protein DAEQUDRAFT_769914 [Daedalea quercina L-15889]